MKRRTFLFTTATATILAGFRAKLGLAKGNDMSDPLLAPWTGAHGGVPPFDKIKPADWKPALEKGMAAYKAETTAIGATAGAATFANTIAALENSGRPFNRAATLFGVYTST